ncbi:MAG TPA: pentapeptide repeat-containing protein, partial [Gammaproteobacteria bacterium]|nr:pentapeptide repeat-containing protein [Gammaproteobacteria bacterium]
MLRTYNNSFEEISQLNEETIDLDFFANTLERQSVLEKEIINLLENSKLDEFLEALNLPFMLEKKKKKLIYRIVNLLESLRISRNIDSIADGVKADLELRSCLLIIVKASGSALITIPNIGLIASKSISILNAANIAFAYIEKIITSSNQDISEQEKLLSFENNDPKLLEINFSTIDFKEMSIFEKKVFHCLDYEALRDITQAIKLALPIESRLKKCVYRIICLINDSLNCNIKVLSDAIQSGDWELQWCLLVIVKVSGSALQNICNVEKVASRAITILNIANISFSGMDFSGIRIPNADLRQAILDSTDFSQADLSGIKLHGAWLQNANLRGAQLSEASFGEYPSLYLEDSPESCCYSSDGCWLVVAVSNNIYLYEVYTYQRARILSGHTEKIMSVASRPNSNQIASGGNDSVRLWDAKSGKELINKLMGHQGGVHTIAFSPDGSHLAAGCDYSIWIWDVEKGQKLRELVVGHQGSLRAVAFNRDGSQLAAGGEYTFIQLWDANSGQELKKLFVTANVASVAFSPDGSQLVSGGRDFSVSLWDAKSGQELKKLHVSDMTYVACVTFSPDGSQIVSVGNDKYVRLWDRKNGQELKKLVGHRDCSSVVTFSPDGNQVASGSRDKSVRVWDVKIELELKDKPVWPEGCHLTGTAFSLDSTQVAFGRTDACVWLWELSASLSFKKLKLQGHSECVQSVAFSLNSLQLASGSTDGSIRLWDTINGQELKKLSGHTNWVSSVAFSPDGEQLISGGHDNTVRLWDVKSGQELKSLKHNNRVHCIAFSPYGTRIAFGGVDDGSVQLLDAVNWPKLKNLGRHNGVVYTIVFSPDGSQLASAGGDPFIRLWDVESGEELKKFESDK